MKVLIDEYIDFACFSGEFTSLSKPVSLSSISCLMNLLVENLFFPLKDDELTNIRRGVLYKEEDDSLELCKLISGNMLG